MTQTLDVLRPSSADELRDMVAAASGPLSIEGAGTKAAWSHSPEVGQRLSTSQLSGIDFFYPAEMVVQCGPGTRLADLEAELQSGGHRLAFDPPDLGPLFGKPAGQSSIAGVVAANLAGSRRAFRGGPRDHLLGVKFVNGSGEAIKSGGRVMKNVSGYDLCKLMTGSWGTLGVLSQVTMKTAPLMEMRRTVVVQGLEEAQHLAALIAASRSPYDLVAAAYLPAGEAATLGFDASVSLLEIEGLEPSVLYRSEQIATLLAKTLTGQAPSCRNLDQEQSANLWRSIKDLAPVLGQPQCLWRLKPKPSDAAAVMAQLRARFDGPGLKMLVDWGGNLVWLASDQAISRADLAGLPGQKTQLIGSDDQPFEPLHPLQTELQSGIKRAFDPDGRLNPQRLYSDF